MATQSAPLRFFAHLTELNREYPGQLGVALYRVDGPIACRRGTRQGCGGPTLAWSYTDAAARNDRVL